MSKWVEGRVAGRRRWTGRRFSLGADAPADPFRPGQFTRAALHIGAQRVVRPYSCVNAPDERPLEFCSSPLPRAPDAAARRTPGPRPEAQQAQGAGQASVQTYR